MCITALFWIRVCFIWLFCFCRFRTSPVVMQMSSQFHFRSVIWHLVHTGNQNSRFWTNLFLVKMLRNWFMNKNQIGSLVVEKHYASAHVIDWQSVQGVPSLLPNDCWNWLQAPVILYRISGIDNRWMEFLEKNLRLFEWESEYFGASILQLSVADISALASAFSRVSCFCIFTWFLSS